MLTKKCGLLHSELLSHDTRRRNGKSRENVKEQEEATSETGYQSSILIMCNREKWVSR